jgi:drug/metabolite transporter (DMT)-like permease
MAPGDALVLVSAFFWTSHILLIAHFAPRMDAIALAIGQFAVCSILSLAVAVSIETIELQPLLNAAIPVLYGALLSIGIAYTLQIIAQKTAHPAHASIIMSMESLFAGIGGVLLLHEPLSARIVLGAGLMLAGMIVSQLGPSAASSPR